MQDRLAEADVPYDAALVAIDLAAVYAADGRTAEMKQLAQEMLPIFQSRQLSREVLAALVVFRQAVDAEEITLSLVQEVGDFLTRSRIKPGLRFRPEV